ncbi:MAG: hypothetical protein DRP95_00445 [Candidatus Latescibacterota bacterium]|nr:MAG: hypothetical protein DRP95_00445 [Candidatus Latescibacterota bacterium]
MQEGSLREEMEQRPYEEVDLFDYIEVLVKRRWLIVFGTAVCVLTTLIYSLTAEKRYKAEATILPAEERDYLAQLLGGAGGQPAPGRSFYIDILKSIPVTKAVLEKEYTYHVDGEERKGTLMEYFRARTVHQGIRALQDIAKFSEARNTGIITISVTTTSPDLSAAVANEYVRQLQIYNTERRKTRAKEQMEFIEKRLKEVKRELAEAEQKLADFKKRNRNLITLSSGPEGKSSISFSSPELAMELSRLEREVTVKSDLFQTLTRQYELVRIEAKKETPVIEVLNYAEPPDRPTGKGKKFLLLLSFVTGGFVSVGMAFFLEYVEKAHRSGRTRTVIKELRKDKERILRIFGRNAGDGNISR